MTEEQRRILEMAYRNEYIVVQPPMVDHSLFRNIADRATYSRQEERRSAVLEPYFELIRAGFLHYGPHNEDMERMQQTTFQITAEGLTAIRAVAQCGHR
jgi:hypothetical protein